MTPVAFPSKPFQISVLDDPHQHEVIARLQHPYSTPPHAHYVPERFIVSTSSSSAKPGNGTHQANQARLISGAVVGGVFTGILLFMAINKSKDW